MTNITAIQDERLAVQSAISELKARKRNLTKLAAIERKRETLLAKLEIPKNEQATLNPFR